MRDTIGKIFDVQGPHAPVIEKLNMPPSFVILDRVVWGVSAHPRQARGDRPVARRCCSSTSPTARPPPTSARAEAAWAAGRPIPDRASER